MVAETGLEPARDVMLFPRSVPPGSKPGAFTKFRHSAIRG